MRLLLVAVLAGCVSTAIPVAQEVLPEYRVKAEYLYNFVKYVEWPDPSNRTVRICVAGQNPFGNVLNELIRNERILRMPPTKTILEPEPGCDVIFAPRTSTISAYLRASAGMPILTVGETPRFIEQGGLVRFFTEDGGGVRFEIDRIAAERVGLRISSRLLQLAQITERGPDEK